MTGNDVQLRTQADPPASRHDEAGDAAYFAHRAEAEIMAAQLAAHPAAVAAHYAMSRAYLDLAYPEQAERPSCR